MQARPGNDIRGTKTQPVETGDVEIGVLVCVRLGPVFVR